MTLVPESISVIIPAYRAEGTIGAAVRSVLDQTHADIEVIVIDDGSPDDSARAARTAGSGDSRLSVIAQANLGVSGARNAGLDRATGTWIALLDADDTFEASRLQRMLEAAQSCDADMVADNILLGAGTRFERAAFPQKRMTRSGFVDAAEFVAADRPRRGLSSAGFIKPLIRRDFLERHHLRYQLGVGAGEDFDLYVRALLRGARLTYIPDALYRYTVQESSLSRGDERGFFEQFQSVSSRLIDGASGAGRAEVVRALAERDRDTRLWFASLDFEKALARGDLAGAAKLFGALPSKSHGLYLIASSVKQNLTKRGSGV